METKDQSGSVDRLSLRPPEAARMLGVSARTLYNWAKRGVLKPIKIGRVCIYPRSQLERFLEEFEAEGFTPQRKGED